MWITSHARHAVHHLAREVQRRAESGRCVGVFAGLLLEGGQQFPEIRREKILPGREDIRQLPHAADEGEIAARVKGKLGIASDRSTFWAMPPRPTVYPSGCDFATASAPSTPPAPALFSTTNDCPDSSLYFWHRMRDSVSVVAPGREAVDVARRPGRPGLLCEGKLRRQQRRGDRPSQNGQQRAAVHRRRATTSLPSMIRYLLDWPG